MTLPLVPAPFTVRRGGDRFLLPARLPILVSHENLLPLVSRFTEDVRTDGGPDLDPVTSTAAPADADPEPGPDRRPELRISLVTEDRELDSMPPATGVRADRGGTGDEHHALTVTATGIQLRARTPEGVFRGLTTLRQLLVTGAAVASSQGVAELTLEEMHIRDAPRFAWRGLSLDVARAPHSSEQIRRTLDILALHKMNVLHLHLTDDQAWRIPVPTWPRLAASQPEGTSFSSGEIDALVTYARERFITIVPEIDMPGHCGAAVAAYPELCGAPEGNLLDPDRDITWRFVHDVLSRTAALFTDSRFLHVGGDETFGMPAADHARFVSRARAIVSSLGRRTIGWQEIARGELRAGDLVQYWIEDDFVDQLDFDSDLLADLTTEMKASLVETFTRANRDLPAALAQGAGIIASPMSSMYLDHPYGEPSLEPADHSLRDRLGMPVYTPLPVRAAYESAAAAFVGPLSSHEVVAGVEAAIWCESVEDGMDLEFLLLPRLAGIAEVTWSTPAAIGWDDYRERLARVATAWAAREWRWFRSAAVEWAGAGRE